MRRSEMSRYVGMSLIYEKLAAFADDVWVAMVEALRCRALADKRCDSALHWSLMTVAR